MKRTRRRRRGFTLIEVLAVLVILVMLGSLVGLQVMKNLKSAKVKSAKAQIASFDTPLQSYALNMGDYPSTSAGLEALRSAPSEGDSSKWEGPYLTKPVPVDPWGNAYNYDNSGNRSGADYDVWSMGEDGVDGTEDDIGNW